MPRKRRPLDRTAGALRDTSIVVVACEDMHAVKQYFAKFRTRRTQFKVLATEDGNSSPRSVIDRLHAYRQKHAQEDGDELWLCIDADHWINGNHQRELSQVLRECRQNGYGVAISNPCFEFWLLLHFTDVNDETLIRLAGKDEGETLDAQDLASLQCAPFEAELRNVVGSYKKSRVSALAISASQVQQATERARTHDTGDGEIPLCPGTRVYQLIETLSRRDSISLGEE